MYDLIAQDVPGFGGDLVVGNGSVGVQVRVLLGAVEPRQLDPSLEHAASP
jgi:hypothetical protein